MDSTAKEWRSNKSADETVSGKTSNNEENGKLFQTVSY